MKKRLFTGIFLFGSIWGFAECIFGPMLSDAGLPSGAILTGVVASGVMVVSRVVYRMRGMQLGMGLVAGTMRLLNPFGGCYLCNAIAIMAAGAVFELIWLGISTPEIERMPLSFKCSLGVVSAYVVFVIGYVVTQVLTPMLTPTGFHFSNLVVFIPQILARGLPAAVLGGVTTALAFSAKKWDFTIAAGRAYYPITIGIAVLCWAVVIVNANQIPSL